MLTTPTEVHWIVVTAVLFGNNVIDVKGRKGSSSWGNWQYSH